MIENETISNIFCYLARNPTALILGASFCIAVMGYLENKKIAKYQRTILFKQNTFNTDFQGNLQKLRETVKPLDSDNIKNLAKEESINLDSTQSMRNVLNYYEDMAIGIRKKVYDDNYLIESTGYTVVKVYDLCKPYISELNKNRNKTAYINLSLLVKKWRDKIDI